MLYAILCYNEEKVIGTWTKEEDDATMTRLLAVQAPLAAAKQLGPVARLEPTTKAVTVRKTRAPFVMDGPFAETKEQLLGFYVAEFASIEDATAFVHKLSEANPGTGSYEIRPVQFFAPGTLG